jgi:predicted transposase/invertase (TIGR01784 family)
MKIGINPWVDMVFKQIFGCEENKELLLSLVNAVMEEAGESSVVELDLLNPYNPKTSSQDKMSIVDIKARDEKGEWFLIEVQVQMYGYFLKRLLYYWARHYQSQLKEAELYDKLKKVTVICFTVEELPIPTTEYYNFFQIMDVKNHVCFADDLAIHTIELPKFLLSEQKIGKAVERWTYFLKHGESLDDENLPQSLRTPEMEKAVKQLRKFSLDEHQREAYEVRLKAMRDEKASLAAEFQKGEERGKEEGRKEGEEIGIKKGKEETVVNALRAGLPVDTIVQITGLSGQEIEKIKKSGYRENP